jgi:hypothetical protein
MPSLVRLVIDQGADVSRRVEPPQQTGTNAKLPFRSVGYNLARLAADDDVKLEIMKLLVKAGLQVTQDGALVVKELITMGEPCIPVIQYLFTPVGEGGAGANIAEKAPNDLHTLWSHLKDRANKPGLKAGVRASLTELVVKFTPKSKE